MIFIFPEFEPYIELHSSAAPGLLTIDFLLCEKFRTFLCVHSGRTKSLLKKGGVARSAALSILENGE